MLHSFYSVLWTTFAHELILYRLFCWLWFIADHSKAQIRWKQSCEYHSEGLFDDSQGYWSFSVRDVTLSPRRHCRNLIELKHCTDGLSAGREKPTHLPKFWKSSVLISEREERKTKMLYIPPQPWPLFSLSKTVRMTKMRIAFNQPFLPSRTEEKPSWISQGWEVQASTVTKFNFSSFVVWWF